MGNNAPFLSIKDACAVTGLSQNYLRQGCRDGSIPHICAGAKYLINTVALLEQLDRQSREAVR